MRYVVIVVMCSLTCSTFTMDVYSDDDANLKLLFSQEELRELCSSQEEHCRNTLEKRYDALNKQVETNCCRNVCIHVTTFAFASFGWIFSCVALQRIDSLDPLTNIVSDNGKIPEGSLLASCGSPPPPSSYRTAMRGVNGGAQSALSSILRESLIVIGYTPKEAAIAQLSMSVALAVMHPDSLLPLSISLFVKTTLRQMGVSETRARYAGAFTGYSVALWRGGWDSLAAWRICDANEAMHTAHLTNTPGRVLRLVTPQLLP